MEKLFIGMATSQIALYFTLEYGMKKGILKKDMYMNIVKISCVIVTLTSMYILSN
ncbi:MAG: hypothetical protein J6D47_00185 [Peptostreptococcaceae bacterium]|nr:hypothetical protein [Peptostreptococcaceae bacterium]